MKKESIGYVYITNPDKKTAERIAKDLLKNRMIACANIFPIQSIYRWKGKITKEKEIVLIGKTSKKRYEEIKKRIKEIHPYSIPCILFVEAKANKEYREWVFEEIAK